MHLAIQVPPTADVCLRRAYLDACVIAGIDKQRVSLVHEDDALVAAYAKKISGILPVDRAEMNGKNVILIEMGHAHSTVVVAGVQEPVESGDAFSNSVIKKSCEYDPELGAVHFDLRIFDHFASICKSKFGTDVKHGTKAGKRLLVGCEKIRKLLSQIKETKVTVENLTDGG